MAADAQIKFGRGDVISRKYEIEDQLGSGVFGTTYLARHIASGRHVVVKFLKPALLEPAGALERFKEAFAKAKGVRHANLIKYGEINEHNGQPYLTQEYFRSQNLREVIDEAVNSGQIFTLQDTCQIVIKVLEALEEAHKAGITHRNVKPENILVRTDTAGPGGSRKVRKIKLSDLGITDVVDLGQLGDRYDSEFDSSYLAPELVSYGQQANAQADVYSAGVVLYELLCGQVPRGTFFSPTQVRDDLPEHVDQVVELALSPEAGDRYPSAQDMILDIQRSFNVEFQDSDSGGSNVRNMLFGLGAAVAVIAGVGLYFGLGEPADLTADAIQQDEVLRKQVQAENPLPSEAQIRAMRGLAPDMAYVPGGTFVMGRLNSEDREAVSPSEPAAVKVHVEPFFIDRLEFPNRKGDKSVSKVSWQDAENACNDQGKRLCSAQEWEKACKGYPNFVYSYGDTWDGTMCGDAMDQAYLGGERKDCVSGYGVYDMSGGFREWTASATNRKDRRIVKGGLRGNSMRGSRCAFSVDEDMGYAEATLTFRCCMDVDGNVPKDEPAEGAEGSE